MSTSGPDDGLRAQELLERGAGLYEEGKLYEAISCWRRVLEIDPDNEIAAEYLRFIEDNFQIGIDAFLEHHQESSRPRSTFDGNDLDLAAAIDDSINAILDESIEELDWAELLEDGPDPNEEPPPPSEIAEEDEDFFADLGEGSLAAEPGTEAEAWGMSADSPNSSGGLISAPGQSLEIMPEGDPFTLPTARFAVDLPPGDLELDLGLLDDLDDPLADSLEPGNMQADARKPAAAETPARPADPPPRRDLADMSEDSIDSMLDEDFKAWDERTSDRPAESSEELPFETRRSNPPAPADQGNARPARPSLDEEGVPVERRRPPSFDASWVSGSIDPGLQRHTGPMERVDARVQRETGVQRATRTTPPTAVSIPVEVVGSAEQDRAARPSSVPPPPPAEALESPADRQATARSTPAYGLEAESGARPTPAYGLEAATPSDSVELRRAQDAERRAEEAERRAAEAERRAAEAERRREAGENERRRLAAEADRLREAQSRRAAEARRKAEADRAARAESDRLRPAPPEPPRDPPPRRPEPKDPNAEAQRVARAENALREAQAEQAVRDAQAERAREAAATDLDDDLRALLTAGIAEIEAAETPGSARRRKRVDAPPPGTDLDSLMAEARRRQQADDFSGSIALVEQVLAGNPEHPEARRYLEENTERLLAMYRSRLGSLGRIPRVKLRQQEIVWQSLDHREGFILSQVDGRTTFEEIIDISGMSELESTRILARLVDHGVIS